MLRTLIIRFNHSAVYLSDAGRKEFTHINQMVEFLQKKKVRPQIIHDHRAGINGGKEVKQDGRM